MSRPLFREKPLEKLASPEQLDELMQLNSSRPWFALAGVLLLLLVFLIWSFLGTVATKVTGRGVLVKPESVSEIAAIGFGKVVEIAARPGQHVQPGDTLAIISQPELAIQLINAKQELTFYEKQLAETRSFNEQDIVAQKDFLAKKRQDLNHMVEVLEAKLKTLAERIETEKKLLAKGLITKQDLDNSRQLYTNTQHEKESYLLQIKQIDLDLRNVIKQNTRQNNDLLNQRNQARHKLQLLEAQLGSHSVVISPFSGVILEVVAKEGDLVQIGFPILSLEQTTKVEDLVALVYVPAADGKKIKVGMEAYVAPSVVRVEEHGYIKGTVIAVSDFPATKQAMENEIGNPQLVQSLLNEQDALITVQIRLHKKPNAASQYNWTASAGPDIRIQTGTLCKAQVTTEKRKPIQFLFR